MFARGFAAALFALIFVPSLDAADPPAKKMFRAGAFAMDVTPTELPVIVNGGMTEAKADKIVDRLHARCLVLDDGTTSIVIAVVDNCMMPRDLLDEAKRMASAATKIPPERMLISATHTHAAPSVTGCLGSDVDTKYAAVLPGLIARGIERAYQNLAPAQIGWGAGRDEKNIYCRHFLMKPGTATTNPFSGTRDDLAQMNPGFNNPNILRRTSVVDTEVSVLAVRAPNGRPLAVLGNYSTHYAGSPAISSDYFGVFCDKIATHVKADEQEPRFVGLMTNATSGDANCVDFFANPPRKFDYHSVGADVAAAAFEGYQKIEWFDWVPIVMAESKLTLKVRLADAEELAKAKEVVAELKGGKPKTVPQVYAREAVLLSEMPPTRELKLQAIRLGDLGISAIPNEVFNITGLTIKQRSPIAKNFTIELANGAEGYIPPPDQHALGGYTAWRARTACLEVLAEPKILVEVLDLLAKVHKERRDEKSVTAATPK